MSPGYPGSDYDYEQEARRVLDQPDPLRDLQRKREMEAVARRAPGPGTNTLPPDYTPPEVPNQEDAGAKPPSIGDVAPPQEPQPISFGETKTIAQLQQGLTEADEAVARGEIYPQERDQHVAQIQQRLKPLLAKQAQTAKQAQKAAAQQAMEGQALMTSMGLADAAHKAKGFAQTVARVVNEMGKVAHIGPDGKEIEFKQANKEEEFRLKRMELQQKAAEGMGLPAGLEDLYGAPPETGQSAATQAASAPLPVEALKRQSAQTGQPIALDQLAQAMTQPEDTKGGPSDFEQTIISGPNVRKYRGGVQIQGPAEQQQGQRTSQQVYQDIWNRANASIPQLGYNATPEQHQRRNAAVQSLAHQMVDQHHQQTNFMQMAALREQEHRRQFEEKKQLLEMRRAATRAMGGVDEKRYDTQLRAITRDVRRDATDLAKQAKEAAKEAGKLKVEDQDVGGLLEKAAGGVVGGLQWWQSEDGIQEEVDRRMDRWHRRVTGKSPKKEEVTDNVNAENAPPSPQPKQTQEGDARGGQPQAEQVKNEVARDTGTQPIPDLTQEERGQPSMIKHERVQELLPIAQAGFDAIGWNQKLMESHDWSKASDFTAEKMPHMIRELRNILAEAHKRGNGLTKGQRQKYERIFDQLDHVMRGRGQDAERLRLIPRG